MYFPKTVTVAGVRIKVVRASLMEDECFGLWSHDQKVITIDSALTGELLISTLRHEMCEAALSLSGIGWCEGSVAEATEGIIRMLDEILFPAWEPIFLRMIEK